MTNLWLGAAALLSLALLCIGFPWLRKSTSREHANNIILTKQRLAELEKDQHEGLISLEDKQTAIAELKTALAVEQGHSSNDTRINESSSGIALPWCIGLLIALGAGITVYWQQQQSGKLELWQQARERLPELSRRVVVEADESITAQELQLFGLGLRTKLAEKGDDPVGWLLLGRVYAANQRLDMALDAFEKSYALDPSKSGTLLSYSQALVTVGDENSLRRAVPMLRRYLDVTPADTGAITMLAFAATELGQRELAISSWQKALSQLEPEAPFYRRIQQELAKLGVDSSNALDQGPSIKVTVSLDDTLTSSLPSDGTLFVFARDAVGENPMPAAVIKQPLTAFPVAVTLTNSNAMVPGYNLGSLNRVKVTARVSADQAVTRSAGDLEGEIVVELKSGKEDEREDEHLIVITTEVRE